MIGVQTREMRSLVPTSIPLVPVHRFLCVPSKITRLGSTASQVVRLIGLLLVFASQKIVHKVQNEMAESIVPLRKKIEDSLTRQGMCAIQSITTIP